MNHNAVPNLKLASLELRKLACGGSRQSFPPALSFFLGLVQGNDRCVDCGDSNPLWANVRFGVMLCLQCGDKHMSSGRRRHGSNTPSNVLSLVTDPWMLPQVLAMMEGGNKGFIQCFESHQRNNYHVFGRRRSNESAVSGRRDSLSTAEPNSGNHDEQSHQTSLDAVGNSHAPPTRRGSFFGAIKKKQSESNDRGEEATWESKYESKSANSGNHDEQSHQTSLDVVGNSHAPPTRRGSFFGAITKKRSESNDRGEEATWESKYENKSAKAYRKELSKRVMVVARSYGYKIEGKKQTGRHEDEASVAM